MTEQEKTYTQEQVDSMIRESVENATAGRFTQEDVNRMIADRLKREKDTLDAYKAQMSAEAAAQAEAKAMQERFNAAMGDKRKPVHPRMLPLMLEDFTNAVKDPANKGKADVDVFSALFSDGYLIPANANYGDFFAMPRLPRVSEPGRTDPVANAFGLPRKE